MNLSELFRDAPLKEKLVLPFSSTLEASYGRPFPSDVRELIGLSQREQVPSLFSVVTWSKVWEFFSRQMQRRSHRFI